MGEISQWFKNSHKNVAAWLVAFSAYTMAWVLLDDLISFFFDLSKFQLFENDYSRWKGYEFLAAIVVCSGYAMFFIYGLKQRSVSMLWVAFWLSIISPFALMFVPGGSGHAFANLSISQAIPYILRGILNIYSVVAILLVVVINRLYKNNALSEKKRLIFSGLLMGLCCSFLVLLGRVFLGMANLWQIGAMPIGLVSIFFSAFIIITKSFIFWEALVSGAGAGILAALTYRRFSVIPINQDEATFGIPEGT